MTKINVLIIDDHRIIRDAISALLNHDQKFSASSANGGWHYSKP